MKSLKKFRIFLKHLFLWALDVLAFAGKATTDPNSLEKIKLPVWQDYIQTE